MIFIRSDKKGTRSQRIMRNIIWKSIQNRPDDMLNRGHPGKCGRI